MTGKKRYRQAILIPEGVTPTVFALPCIYSCHKEPVEREQGKDGEDRIVYLLYDWDEQGRYVELRPGQWLCEDYDGKWEVKDKI